MDLDSLKTEALEACTIRGHKMGRWHDHDWYKDTIKFAHCLDCDAQVVVNSRPQPNEIDICGEAVALNCPSTDIRSDGYVVCVDLPNKEECDQFNPNVLDFLVGARYGWRRPPVLTERQVRLAPNQKCLEWEYTDNRQLKPGSILVQPKRGVDCWYSMSSAVFERCFKRGE